MKRFWILVFVLVCLSGCGRSGIESQVPNQMEMAQSVTTSSESVVDTMETPESFAETAEELESSTLAEDAAPEPVVSEEPAPYSLMEMLPVGPQVLVEGQEVPSVIWRDMSYIRADDLSGVLPLFSLETGDTGMQVSLTWNGDVWAGLECILVNGKQETLETNVFQGLPCGIWFQGEATEYWLPVRWTATQLGLDFLWDEEWQRAYMGIPVDVASIPQQVDVPILMYHAVSDDLWGIESLFVSPEDMRAQLEYLLDNGYQPIWFSDLPNLNQYEKPILLTFDDGYDDNYYNLYPLLQEYGVKATVFVITGLLNTEHYMTSDQTAEMSRSGLVDIQSHTVDHAELETLSYEWQDYQLCQSKIEVARLTGKIPYVVAYPSGSRNDDTLLVTPLYYTFGVDMNGGTWNIQQNYYQIPRIYISRSDDISTFATKVSQKSNYLVGVLRDLN